MTDKIILILGAGASMPFGQPSGKQLIKQVSDSLHFAPRKIYKQGQGSGLSSIVPGVEFDESGSDNELVQMLMDEGFGKGEIEYFKESLIESQINSVDAFLEHRTEFIPIGKMAIAYNLLMREQVSKIVFKENPDWYNYIWNKLVTRVNEFPKNEIAFITFNYDRTLEYFLYNSFKSLYGLVDDEIEAYLNKIEIVHLHGILGNLPHSHKKPMIEFGGVPTESTELKVISESIKIIHEDISKNEEFLQAFELMRMASKIYFLGFGYNQVNIDRLGINRLNKSIRGTSVGLTENEKKSIEKINSSIELVNYPSLHCLDFLKEYVELK